MKLAMHQLSQDLPRTGVTKETIHRIGHILDLGGLATFREGLTGDVEIILLCQIHRRLRAAITLAKRQRLPVDISPFRKAGDVPRLVVRWSFWRFTFPVDVSSRLTPHLIVKTRIWRCKALGQRRSSCKICFTHREDVWECLHEFVDK